MKKIISVLSVLLGSLFFITGCGQLINPARKDGKEILISVYNGGFGVDWIDPVIADFEADYPEYTVEIEDRKRTVEEISNLIALGQQADAYISCVADFHQEIYKGNLEDLSDILEMKVDGDDRTIASKVTNLDLWKKVASKDGEGIYMLPYEDSVLGFIYDHGKFVEMGLLYKATNDSATKTALKNQKITFTESGTELIFKSSENRTNYKEGDVILRAGKDGKYGTYDDGQPITIDEWNKMFSLLDAYGNTVIYSGQVLDYTTDIFNGIFAQYDGVDAWNTFFSYSGSYQFEGDSAPTTISMQDGYKVFGMTGIKKATEFLQTYLNNKQAIHDVTDESSVSHTETQAKFVLGTAKPSTDAPFVGLLVDGAWWENESRKLIFKDLEASNVKGFSYGERDYRFMLYPEIPGQKGADGKGNGSVVASRTAGSFIVPKNKNADILEKTKIFLSYTLKDEHLSNFTALTGGIQPYNYTLTDEQLNSMTPFARNYWEMYHDTENIKIVRPLLDRYLSPLPYKTSKGNAVNWYSKIGAVSYNMPLSALRIAETSLDPAISADPVMTVFKGFEEHFKKNWPTYMNELKIG